jgi:hypothetical protein
MWQWLYGNLLKRNTGDLPHTRSLKIPEKPRGSRFGRDAAGANIRQAVAVGIGAFGVRVPSEIGSEAVGRREAGTFADEDEAEAGSKVKTDGIADCNPALLYQGQWGDGPACREELWEKSCEQRNRVALRGQSGEAISDDEGEVTGGGLKLDSGVGVEGPAKHWLAEIRSTVGSVGPELEHGNCGFSEDWEFGVKTLGEGAKVEKSLYGVACPRVGELEVEHFRRGDAVTSRGEGYSGGSELAEVETRRSWDEIGHRVS